MRSKRSVVVASVALLALLPSRDAAAGIVVVNVTPAFYPGTYVGLSVDPRNIGRVAVTTEDGVVSLSEDGGRTARTGFVVTPRRFVSSPLRSQPSHLSLRQEGISGRAFISGLQGDAPGTRYFLHRLTLGLPNVKWHYWMSIDDPATMVFDVAWQAPSSLLVATASGAFVGDAMALGFTQLVGAPHPRGERLRAQAVDVDPADPRRVLVATAEGVLVSTNGGRTFSAHPDLEDVEVRRFYRDPNELPHIFALAGRSLYHSRDGGRKFEAAFTTDDGVHAVAVDEHGAYLATGRGLVMPGSDRRWREREKIVGVIALGEKWLIVAGEEQLWLVDDGGGTRTLLRTGEADPILRLEGSGAGAYVLTKHNLYRLATRREERVAAARPPQLLLSQEEVERAALRRAGLLYPASTRLGAPRESFLLPRLTVGVTSEISREFAATWDALFPLSERVRRASGAGGCCGLPVGIGELTVMAVLTWNLSGLLARKQPSNPNSLVESELREAREKILTEVRWRYSDAAAIAHKMRRPPAAELARVLEETRLAEHVAYLEAMTGRNVMTSTFE